MVNLINTLQSYVTNNHLFASFDYGEDVEINLSGDKQYPQMFLEEPLNISLDEQDYFDYEFGLLMLGYENTDKIYKNDTENIQKFIDDIRNLCNHFEDSGYIVAKPLNFLTLRGFSGDECYGIRIEMSVKYLKKC